MEELFVYALLYSIGYSRYDEYQLVLDKLFLNDPVNEELLNLEGMKCKDAMLHLFSLMQASTIDQDKFGPLLMSILKSVYQESDIRDFGRKMYKLWQMLPSSMNEKEPFFTFCYADDCLSYDDEQQCRALYENAFNYYENEQ